MNSFVFGSALSIFRSAPGSPWIGPPGGRCHPSSGRLNTSGRLHDFGGKASLHDRPMQLDEGLMYDSAVHGNTALR